MINPKKSLIILSHPRSGSNWFSDSLKMFGLAEFFSLSNSYDFKSPKRPVIHQRFLPIPPVEQQTDIISERISQFYKYQQYHGAVSVKIHTLYWHPLLLSFIRNEKFQIVDLRRKDVVAILWSYIIALTTQEFKGLPTPQTITISRPIFDLAISNLIESKNKNVYLHHSLPGIATIYYEDCLLWRESEFWRTTVTIPIQNARGVTTIANRNQVDHWFSEIDWKLLFPPDHRGVIEYYS